MPQAMALLLVLLTPLRPTDDAGLRWSIKPHRVVARIAEARLTPTARGAVRRLLGTASLADVSNWADDIRGKRPNTANWHYVNIPLADSVYRPAVHCPRGCVIRAFEAQHAVLADARRAAAIRTEALKYLVHLVADVHNPMHAGDRGDRGGNDLVVWYGARRTNLHAFWDSGLLSAARLSEDALVDRIRGRLRTRRDLDTITSGSFVTWALESHDVARDVAYRELPDDYRLDRAYVDRSLPALEEQLLRAGVRLAAVLNALLDPARG